MNEFDVAALVVVHVGLYLDSKIAFRYTTRQGIPVVTNKTLHDSK